MFVQFFILLMQYLILRVLMVYETGNCATKIVQPKQIFENLLVRLCFVNVTILYRYKDAKVTWRELPGRGPTRLFMAVKDSFLESLTFGMDGRIPCTQ